VGLISEMLGRLGRIHGRREVDAAVEAIRDRFGDEALATDGRGGDEGGIQGRRS
jgi:hypothetical protein